jgi:4-amino-4-deoxychorismate lyase
MSQFIESIKIEDQEVFLLELHQKRECYFCTFWDGRFYNLAKIIKDLKIDEDGFLN